MEVNIMTRKNRGPEENKRRSKIRELLVSSNVMSLWATLIFKDHGMGTFLSTYLHTHV